VHGGRTDVSIPETEINNWTEAQNSLFAASWNAEYRKYISPYVFRGHENKDWNLTTTLERLIAPHTLRRELALLRNFKKYAENEVTKCESDWHWLSIAQHHGVPTRLLDWTYSPFVALHFATADIDQFHRDGAVWAVDDRQVHELAPRTPLD
jgi:aminoglycoside phosphotransferase